jgi:hypothetical protein
VPSLDPDSRVLATLDLRPPMLGFCFQGFPKAHVPERQDHTAATHCNWRRDQRLAASEQLIMDATNDLRRATAWPSRRRLQRPQVNAHGHEMNADRIKFTCMPDLANILRQTGGA